MIACVGAEHSEACMHADLHANARSERWVMIWRIVCICCLCMSGERGELTKVMSFCFLLVSFFKPCIASHCCIAFGDGGDLHVRLWNCEMCSMHCPLMHMVVVVVIVLPLSEAKAKAKMALGGDKRRV